jgi:NitT/TauT family transport system substrate-binding protein
MEVGVCRRGVAVFALAVCLILASAAAPASSQTPLRLTLDGRIEAPTAPLLFALEQGYFKNEGLEVAIEPSAGGVEPITRVVSGGYELGIADINTLIRYRDQNPNAPIRAIFIVNNRPSYAVIGRKSRGVETLADVQGKRLGLAPAEPATFAWPILARVNQIDPAKVVGVNVGLLVREPMLAAGEVDAVTGASYSTPLNLREKGVPAEDISVFLMAPHGVELYGTAIFANARALAEKPEAIKGFLSGFTQGLKDTIKDPGAAIMPIVRRNGGVTREIEQERLSILIRDSIITAEVRANGLGAVDPARFERALEQLGISHPFKNKPKLEDVFDGSFLPPEPERRLE